MIFLDNHMPISFNKLPIYKSFIKHHCQLRGCLIMNSNKRWMKPFTLEEILTQYLQWISKKKKLTTLVSTGIILQTNRRMKFRIHNCIVKNKKFRMSAAAITYFSTQKFRRTIWFSHMQSERQTFGLKSNIQRLLVNMCNGGKWFEEFKCVMHVK